MHLALIQNAGREYTFAMFQTTSLVTLAIDCEQAVARATASLQAAGLQVHQSFNLQQAKPAGFACLCSPPRTGRCNCHMVVLLVYSLTGPYATLIVLGNETQTRLALVDSPQQPLDGCLAGLIRVSLNNGLSANDADTHEFSS